MKFIVLLQLLFSVIANAGLGGADVELSSADHVQLGQVQCRFDPAKPNLSSAENANAVGELLSSCHDEYVFGGQIDPSEKQDFCNCQAKVEKSVGFFPSILDKQRFRETSDVGKKGLANELKDELIRIGSIFSVISTIEQSTGEFVIPPNSCKESMVSFFVKKASETKCSDGSSADEHLRKHLNLSSDLEAGLKDLYSNSLLSSGLPDGNFSMNFQAKERNGDLVPKNVNSCVSPEVINKLDFNRLFNGAVRAREGGGYGYIPPYLIEVNPATGKEEVVAEYDDNYVPVKFESFDRYGKRMFLENILGATGVFNPSDEVGSEFINSMMDNGDIDKLIAGEGNVEDIFTNSGLKDILLRFADQRCSNFANTDTLDAFCPETTPAYDISSFYKEDHNGDNEDLFLEEGYYDASWVMCNTKNQTDSYEKIIEDFGVQNDPSDFEFDDEDKITVNSPTDPIFIYDSDTKDSVFAKTNYLICEKFDCDNKNCSIDEILKENNCEGADVESILKQSQLKLINFTDPSLIGCKMTTFEVQALYAYISTNDGRKSYSSPNDVPISDFEVEQFAKSQNIDPEKLRGEDGKFNEKTIKAFQKYKFDSNIAAKNKSGGESMRDRIFDSEPSKPSGGDSVAITQADNSKDELIRLLEEQVGLHQQIAEAKDERMKIIEGREKRATELAKEYAEEAGRADARTIEAIEQADRAVQVSREANDRADRFSSDLSTLNSKIKSGAFNRSPASTNNSFTSPVSTGSDVTSSSTDSESQEFPTSREVASVEPDVSPQGSKTRSKSSGRSSRRSGGGRKSTSRRSGGSSGGGGSAGASFSGGGVTRSSSGGGSFTASPNVSDSLSDGEITPNEEKSIAPSGRTVSSGAPGLNFGLRSTGSGGDSVNGSDKRVITIDVEQYVAQSDNDLLGYIEAIILKADANVVDDHFLVTKYDPDSENEVSIKFDIVKEDSKTIRGYIFADTESNRESLSKLVKDQALYARMLEALRGEVLLPTN